MSETTRLELAPLARIVDDPRSLEQLFAEMAKKGHDVDGSVLNAKWEGITVPSGPIDLLTASVQESLPHVLLLKRLALAGVRPCTPEELLRLILQRPDALIRERSLLAVGKTAIIPNMRGPCVVEAYCDPGSGLTSLDPATTTGLWSREGDYLFLVTAHGEGDARKP